MCVQVAPAERAGRVTYYERADHPSAMHQRFRFVGNRPLKASPPGLRGNVIECWETTADGKVQHLSWSTALRVTKGTVDRLMQGARARWRIANETCNTLKKQGSHVAPNFGHGSHHLSVGCAPLMMVAFLVDQVQQWGCPLCQAAWAQWGSTRLLGEKLRAYCSAYALESMPPLLEALHYGLNKSAPTWATDACYVASHLRACLPACTIAVAELYPRGSPKW